MPVISISIPNRWVLSNDHLIPVTFSPSLLVSLVRRCFWPAAWDDLWRGPITDYMDTVRAVFLWTAGSGRAPRLGEPSGPFVISHRCCFLTSPAVNKNVWNYIDQSLHAKTPSRLLYFASEVPVCRTDVPPSLSLYAGPAMEEQILFYGQLLI
mgnify:CR=1 FL=1